MSESDTNRGAGSSHTNKHERAGVTARTVPATGGSDGGAVNGTAAAARPISAASAVRPLHRSASTNGSGQTPSRLQQRGSAQNSSSSSSAGGAALLAASVAAMQQPSVAARSQQPAGPAKQQQQQQQQRPQGNCKNNKDTTSVSGAASASPSNAQQQQPSQASKPKAAKQCKFFSQPGGCSKGASCQFRHDAGATAASPVLRPQGSPAAGKPPTPRLAPTPSPTLTAAAASGAPSMSADESAAAAAAAKKAQASRLFALMQAGTAPKASGHKQGGGGGGGGSGSSANKRSSAKAAASSRAGSADASMSLESFDLSALILSSKEEQLKAQRGRASSRAEEAQQQQQEEEEEAGEQQRMTEKLGSLLSSSPPNATSGALGGSSSSSITGQFRSLYERCKAEEVQLAALLKQQLQSDNRVSAQSLQQNRGRITSLRASIRSGYTELLTGYSPRLAVQKGLVQKLWMSMYREMERLLSQAKERQAATAQRGGSRPQTAAAAPAAKLDLFSSTAAEEEQQGLSRLEQLLDANFGTLDRLAKSIHEQFPGLLGSSKAAAAEQTESSDAQAPTSRRSPETLAAAKQLLSALCVCLGDLERYRQQFLAQGQPSWGRCVFFYTRSLLLDPCAVSAAKSHNQLACVALLGAQSAPSRDHPVSDAFAGHAHFQALYHYVRARHTPVAPFAPARENTLALYEENRRAYESNRPLAPGSECSLLLCGAVRILALLDTRVGMESWETCFQFVLGQQLKNVLNASFFSGGGGGGGGQTGETASAPSPSLSESTMLHLMMLVLYTTDGLVAKDRAAAGGTNANSASATARPVASVLAGISGGSSGSSSGQDSALTAEEAPSVTPTTLPPFHLSQLTRQSLSVLYELLGVLVRVPVLLCSGSGGVSGAAATPAAAAAFYSARSVPFLPSLALAALWIHSAFPWVLTAHDDGSLADEAQLGPSPRESVRVGMVALANLLAQLQSCPTHAAVSATSEALATEASLLELHGFAPLMHQRLWPSKPASLPSALVPAESGAGDSDAPSAAAASSVFVDSFAFQSSALLALARAVLFVHPRSGRLSAHPVALAALSASEMADLAAQQEAWAAARVAEEERKRRALLPSKPKRPSKQAKPRPLRDDSPVAATTEVAETEPAPKAVVHAEGAGALFEGLTDAEADELVFVDPELLPQSSSGAGSGPAASSSSSSPQQISRVPTHLSEMEALVSDEALGISPALGVPAQPQAAATSATAAGAPSLSLGSSLLPVSSASSKPLLVLDGPNIAMRHGAGRVFSVRGIELALEFLEAKLGHRCLIFAPSFVVDLKLIGERRRALKVGMDVKAASLPDNVSLLRQWLAEGRLVTTPSQDYDDSYAVEFAMRHPRALIVSCDQYRDFPPAHGKTPQEQAKLRAWLRAHVVSFAFVADAFMVNPDWKADPVAGLRRVVNAEQGYGHGHGQQQQRAHYTSTVGAVGGSGSGGVGGGGSVSSSAPAIPSYRILR